MNLAQTQVALKAYIFHGDPAILAAVPSTPGFDAPTRLAVYAHAYRARLAGVLHKDFPALAAALGAEADAVFSAYVATHPSTSFTLRDFGARLPAFLAQPENVKAWPWAAELAAFEWAFCEVFDAPEAPILGEAEIAVLPPAAWASLSFALHPALWRVESEFNVLALWKAWKAGEALPEARRLPEAQASVVWRNAERVCQYRSLESDEAAAFAQLARGGGFPEVCAALLPWHEPSAVALRAASLLKTWLHAGWLSGLSWD
ncbi:MAG: putative DNA-binding domain-containing protein [Gammaproteobacteria bacterium]|nr:putative DNA-binding domain-containing protein [Gammaproteobacteria bacterium]